MLYTNWLVREALKTSRLKSTYLIIKSCESYIIIVKRKVPDLMRLPTVIVEGNVLKSWMTLSDCKRMQLAKDLGVSSGRISQLLNSTEEPSAHLMAKLLDRTNLPFTRLFRIIHHKRASSSSRLSSATFVNARRAANGAKAPRVLSEARSL